MTIVTLLTDIEFWNIKHFESSPTEWLIHRLFNDTVSTTGDMNWENDYEWYVVKNLEGFLRF